MPYLERGVGDEAADGYLSNGLALKNQSTGNVRNNKCMAGQKVYG
jgi:hypothetical protein